MLSNSSVRFRLDRISSARYALPKDRCCRYFSDGLANCWSCPEIARCICGVRRLNSAISSSTRIVAVATIPVLNEMTEWNSSTWMRWRWRFSSTWRDDRYVCTSLLQIDDQSLANSTHSLRMPIIVVKRSFQLTWNPRTPLILDTRRTRQLHVTGFKYPVFCSEHLRWSKALKKTLDIISVI